MNHCCVQKMASEKEVDPTTTTHNNSYSDEPEKLETIDGALLPPRHIHTLEVTAV